ncbi:SDR family NAD(P)-dependent oxidoreductase [Tsukamurella sp. 8F]|uniref:SDR family oxidoreductase n=1 Tax=unclassified Tsukamurella TaxID=2633480 RepID=UPI0023B92479|nr:MULTISPECIES: SDR family NAD(P)-dependent oxidoreductase [unclassified Tsukamurella]MDF0530204.1 SDR family NAD(P)-dependent oxidoreductase [Tsukamurella sp. 8J]MDF0586521.1 SDR family NAD(P)-dependent oxidoreductase [Tsukamurella sp. 8F]
MELDGHTVIVVGGTSGIGHGLARRLVDAGSTVVVGGRTTVEGLESVYVDVTDQDSVVRARDEVLASHPDLDVVVTMSGVMLTEDLRDPSHIESAETTVAVNLLGTIRVIDAFTPHLMARGSGEIVTVGSGIAFVPFPLMPTYGASKAGVHSYTESLRAQLTGTGIAVTELIPPAVATTPAQLELNPAALSLDDYLDEALRLLTADPAPPQVVVERAQRLRWAERDGTYSDLLERRSQVLNTLPER